MDLKGTKDNILAKANNGIAIYCYSPSEDGGNSDRGNFNRNAALAHSIKMNNQSHSIGMGFNPFHINEYPIKINQTNSIGMGFNPFHKKKYPKKSIHFNRNGFQPIQKNVNTKPALAK